MINKKTELEDIVDATQALVDWFRSQQIAPDDGIFMCCLVISHLVKEEVRPKEQVLKLLAAMIDGPDWRK